MKKFFTIPTPTKYFFLSIYEKFDMVHNHGFNRNSFSIFGQFHKYHLGLQPQKISIGLNKHCSITFSKQKSKNVSSVYFQFPKIDFSVFFPKGFEINIYNPNTYINLKQNSLFFHGCFTDNYSTQNDEKPTKLSDYMISIQYPQPCSFMGQIKGKYHAIGTSIEFLPNIALYSYFAVVNYRNTKYRICYSNCDTKIFNAILAALAKVNYHPLSLAWQFSMNSLEYGSTMSTANDHSIITFSDAGSIAVRLKMKMNLTNTSSFLLNFRFPDLDHFDFLDTFELFEIREKIPSNQVHDVKSSIFNNPFLLNRDYFGHNRPENSKLSMISFGIRRNSCLFHLNIFDVGNIDEINANLKYRTDAKKWAVDFAVRIT